MILFEFLFESLPSGVRSWRQNFTVLTSGPCSAEGETGTKKRPGEPGALVGFCIQTRLYGIGIVQGLRQTSWRIMMIWSSVKLPTFWLKAWVHSAL